MAADYFVHVTCAPKQALGSGDAVHGTWALHELLKARSAADVIAQFAEQGGRSPAGVSVTFGTSGPDNRVVEKSATFEELLEQSAPLEMHAGACHGCPANVFVKPFGCGGQIPYPISRAAEEWLMKLLQPTTTVGGFLCSHSIKDFGYTGEPIRKMRARGLLESTTPVARVEGSWLSKRTVTSDQILQAMLAVGEPLNPAHCMGVLLWLGCLRLDGKSLFTVSDAPLVQTLLGLKTPDERRSRTTLDVGPQRQDLSTSSLQSLLKAFYLAWVLDVSILISY